MAEVISLTEWKEKNYTWKTSIDISSTTKDYARTNIDFLTARNRIVEMLHALPYFIEDQEFAHLVLSLSFAKNEDEFNDIMDAI